MKRHTFIYLTYFGYDISSLILCEVCGARSVDLHHIIPKGMGGDPTGKRDVIENLIALCRECHNKAHNKEYSKEYLTELHKINLK